MAPNPPSESGSVLALPPSPSLSPSFLQPVCGRLLSRTLTRTRAVTPQGPATSNQPLQCSNWGNLILHLMIIYTIIKISFFTAGGRYL